MTESLIPCPVCGKKSGLPLTYLLEREAYYLKRENRGDMETDFGISIYDRLKPPLGHPPWPPVTWGILVFFVLLVILVQFDIHHLLVAFVSITSTLGIYVGIIKPAYEAKFSNWKNTLLGAYVCGRCYAAFKP